MGGPGGKSSISEIGSSQGGVTGMYDQHSHEENVSSANSADYTQGHNPNSMFSNNDPPNGGYDMSLFITNLVPQTEGGPGMMKNSPLFDNRALLFTNGVNSEQKRRGL